VGERDGVRKIGPLKKSGHRVIGSSGDRVIWPSGHLAIENLRWSAFVLQWLDGQITR
jgi:hypothetical protein